MPYHWGRYRGLAQDMKRPLLADMMKNNVFFDTCVYHQPGIDLLFKIVPATTSCSGREMVGAVRGIDPETGFYYDDTKRYVEALQLSDAERKKIYEGNARQGVPAPWVRFSTSWPRRKGGKLSRSSPKYWRPSRRRPASEGLFRYDASSSAAADANNP